MQVEILLTEEQLASELVAAIRARQLPEKFFYWFPTSVRAWLRLCTDGPYRNWARSMDLVRRLAPDLHSLLPPGDLEVVSLGAGQGDKDLVILQELRAAGRQVSYVPVDASLSLLERAARIAEETGIATVPIKADLLARPHLERLKAKAKDRSQLILLLGNTLGAFDPLGLAASLSWLLRPQDRILVDGELYVGEETLAGYENPLNRAFAWGPLTSLGLGPADGDLVFELRDDGRMEGLKLLRKHFRASRELCVLVAGEELHLAAGDVVHMGHSAKYSRRGFHHILTDQALLRVIREATSGDSQFVLCLAAPSAPGVTWRSQRRKGPIHSPPRPPPGARASAAAGSTR